MEKKFKMVRTDLTLSPLHQKKFLTLSRKTGMTRSELVRRMIDRWYDELISGLEKKISEEKKG